MKVECVEVRNGEVMRMRRDEGGVEDEGVVSERELSCE